MQYLPNTYMSIIRRLNFGDKVIQTQTFNFDLVADYGKMLVKVVHQQCFLQIELDIVNDLQ